MPVSLVSLARALVCTASLLSLVACGVGGPAGIAVSGSVVTVLGSPVSGVSVSVGGAAPVVTAADGSFSTDDVAVPYDLVVFSEAGGWAHVFESLEDADPTVVPFRTPSGGLPSSQALLDVTPSIPLSVGQVLVLCAEHPTRPLALCSEEVGPSSGPFALLVAWEGTGSLEATVRAVVYDVDAADVATAVPYMGTATVVVQDGDTAAVPVPMTIPAPSTLGVDVAVPSAYALGMITTYVVLPTGSNAFRLPRASPPVLPETFELPSVAGSSVGVFADAYAPDGSAALAWSSVQAAPPADVALALTAAPELLAPYDGATGVVPGVTFAVEDDADDAHTFVFDPDGMGPTIAVTTLDGTIEVPDAGTFSTLLAWPSGASYTWTVRSASGYASVADLTSGDGDPEARILRLFSAAAGLGGGPSMEGTATVSAERSFSLQ